MNIEERLDKLEDRVANLEEKISKLEIGGFTDSTLSNFEKNLAKNIDKITITSLVLLALKKHKQTSLNNIKKQLADWGNASEKWFQKGHFSEYIVKKGLAKTTREKKHKSFFH